MTQKYSKKYLLEELERVSDKVDGRLTRPEFNKLADICAWTVEDRYGGWNNAKRAAGLQTIERGTRKKYTGTMPRSRQRDKVRQIKENVPCLSCGNSYPACVMDFHHPNPDNKYHTVGRLVGSYSWKTVKEELRKCVLLCANCHRLVENDDISI